MLHYRHYNRVLLQVSNKGNVTKMELEGKKMQHNKETYQGKKIPFSLVGEF